MRALIDKGVTVDVHGLGPIGRGVGEIILAVLAQVADMERRKIIERTADGRATARRALAETGKTHRGKESLGRPKAHDGAAIAAWRTEHGASIRDTAAQFKVSPASVKRFCREVAVATARAAAAQNKFEDFMRKDDERTSYVLTMDKIQRADVQRAVDGTPA